MDEDGDHGGYDFDFKQKKSSPTRCTDCFKKIPRLIERFFYWYGGIIADNKFWFVAVPIMATLVLAPGIVQLDKITDEDKIWPITSSSSMNDKASRDLFKTYDSICTCQVCDSSGENCTKTTQCDSKKTPKACKGSTDGLDFSCPNLHLMFVSRNRSMTDPEMLNELMQLDMYISFQFYIIQNFAPAFYASNVSKWQICQTEDDTSCFQFSALTGVRQQLSKLPGLDNYTAQLDFLFSLADPKNQADFKEMMQDNANKPTYYPFDSNGQFIGPIYGDVKMDNSSETWRNGVKSAKVKHIGAMQFIYCLNDTNSLQAINTNWTRQVTNYLERRYTYNKTFKEFDLTVQHSWSRIDRNNSEVQRLIPYLVMCIIALMIYTALTTVRNFPAHRTLPWIGPIGVACSMFGVASSFGLVGWMQMKIVDLCFVVPVLILVVGIDDVFVYADSWRNTNPQWYARRRLAKAMKTAAPGIVVTSFMNMLAFIIDANTLFNAINIFSKVSVIAACFDFVYQMTLFPACMAMLGRIEAKNRNGLCCCAKMKPRTTSVLNDEENGCCYVICCTAPKSTLIKRDVPAAETKKKNDETSVSSSSKKKSSKKHRSSKREKQAAATRQQKKLEPNFFRDKWTKFILARPITVFALLLYAGYLAGCGYLATRITVGMRIENSAPMLPDGKPNEMQVYLQHFRDFSFTIDCLFMDPLEYWENKTQSDIATLYDDMLQIPHIGPTTINRNWLRDFLNYSSSKGYNVSTQESFTYFLREKYFREKNIRQDYFYDVKFADQTAEDYQPLIYNGVSMPPIVASRLQLWATDVRSISVSGDIVKKLRDIKNKQSDNPLKPKFYSREFVDAELLLATSYSVVQNTLIQLVAVLLVTAVMMPHPVALFWIGVMLCSITLGVITITCQWGIQFDQIAMINIMLTMGYCVDFTAHMTRTYVASKAKTRLKKTREALTEFGYPIIQASIAAIIATLCLAESRSYILQCGFKFFVVGIGLSVFHNLCIFPVLLLYLGPGPSKHVEDRSSRSKHRSGGKGGHHHRSRDRHGQHHHSHSRHHRRHRDVEENSEEQLNHDTKKMATSIIRKMSKMQLDGGADGKRIDPFTIKIDGNKKAGVPWSPPSLASVASGPARRMYVPELTEIPPLAEMVTTFGIPEDHDLPFEKNAAMLYQQEDEVTGSTTYTSSDDSGSSSSDYEKPPRF